MAVRPLVFGARFRQKELSVRVDGDSDGRRYVVEVQRGDDRVRRREHDTLRDALRDFAASWRGRLH